MNLISIKSYALTARGEFIQAVTERAALFGIMKTGLPEISFSGDVAMVAGKAVSRAEGEQCEKLCKLITSTSFDQVMDKVAYSWFNRLMAIRYMELHDYLDHGYRVLSSRDATDDQPEILRYAEQVDLPGLDRNKVVELKLDGNKDAELFREVLLGECHALQQAMPFLFESIEDETELLLPENLLHSDSLVRKLVDEIPEEDWDNIEIIGWLYQFYISEKKDQVIGKVVKSEDIPAATQLFTPNWIVKYMVQNSLGAQWLATYPQSPLKGQMEYYIEPAEQTDEVNAQLADITPTELNPEELTLIDPASGSGHILVEAYELFKAIYLERGYRQRDVPMLILEKNLFGLDIDERAAQLTGFALMMKGRADDRRLFERGVKLNVMALVDSAGLDVEGLAQNIKLADYDLKIGDLNGLKELFEHATTFGSLIQMPEALAEKLPALKRLSEATSQDLFVSETLKRLGPLEQQSEILAAQYDAVVANPPYMASKYQTPVLKKYLKDRYEGYEKDFFSAFIDRNLIFGKLHGRLGFMSPFVWMFISSHEQLRTRLIDEESITSLIQLEYSGFEGATVPICTFTLRKDHVARERGCFIRLSDFRGSENQGPRTREAIGNRDCGWLFETAQDDLKRIPGSPVAYWVSARVLELFAESTVLDDIALLREGIHTGDNPRFLRLWQEISETQTNRSAESYADLDGSHRKWVPYNKGGSFRRWFGNNEWVIAFDAPSRNEMALLKSHVRPSESLYFRSGATWSALTSGKFSLRYFPAGFLFDQKGQVLIADDLHHIMGLLNSELYSRLAKVLMPTLDYTCGGVRKLPYLAATKPSTADLTRQAIAHARDDWNAYERSWDFQSLPLLMATSDPTPTLESSYTAWITQNRDTIAEMKLLEEENNRLFIDAYGLGEELTPDVPIEQITLTINPAYRYGGKLTEGEQWARFRQDTMEELVSYAVGCMMGRYSLGAPGLIYAQSGNEGFDPSQYSSFPADDDGIVPLTDIEWFEDDATNRLVEFISVAWDKSHLEENLTFLADNLSPKKTESPRETIRRYLSNSFFKDHMTTYKKRPIYWLFSSGKQKAFQALVYLHRYNEGTLARMRTEYVVPLLGRIPRHIEDLDQEIESAGSTAAQNKLKKQKDKLGKQLDELRRFDEQLRHAADQRISIDLDDGVKVNYGKFGDLLADVKKITGKK